MIHHLFKLLGHTAKATKHVHKTAARSGTMVVGKSIKPHARTSGIVRYWTKSGK